VRIINVIAAQMKTQPDCEIVQVSGLGSFTMRKAQSSWAAKLLLGAFDYYKGRDVAVLQIVPDNEHWTIDVPDMSAPWSPASEPVWQWLEEPWTLPAPKDSTVATNLGALRGERITEVTRWDENEWEMFAGAGPEVKEEDMRVVGLGTLIAADKSLLPVLNLAEEEGLWRDAGPGSAWHPWGNRATG
jgi:hypothetical protein